MKRIIIHLVAVVVISVWPKGYSQNLDDLVAGLQNVMDTKIAGYGLEGVGVTVVFPGEITYNLTSGIATGPGDPVSTDRKWHWASSTKPLTGYVVLKLYEEGKLDINDPIGKYLDADTIPNVDSTIVIKELLRHTSPLEEIWTENNTSLWSAVWNNRDSVWCPWQVLDYMPPPDNSRTTHKYSSSNSYILGFLAEAVTGKDLATLFKELIFDPLGMTNSHLSSCENFNMAELNGVWWGTENRSNWSHTSYLSSRGGNSALISTTSDVARFYRRYYQDSLLSKTIMDSLRVPAKGSRQLLGSIGCASSVYQTYGYETEMQEVNFSSGETIMLYGHGGNGVNNSSSYHWKSENITLILAVNDYSSPNAIASLYADLLCYIHDNLLIIDAIDVDPGEAQITVYPNPASQYLTIEVKDLPETENWVILRDIGGRIIYQEKFLNSRTEIPLTGMKPGVYFYEVILEDKRTTGRFIKN